MLHSTFWNHGAGDLEIPPWALSMFPMPPDLPLKGNNTSSCHASKNKIWTNELRASSGVGSEGVFLDFLYPQQALAWLQRANGQQWQRWEKRNARRLPEGFILATRGYASRSHGQVACPEDNDADDESQETSNNYATNNQRDEDARMEQDDKVWTDRGQRKIGRIDSAESSQYLDALGTTQEEGILSGNEILSENEFADSPADLAELSQDALQRLRRIMMSNQDRSMHEDQQKSRGLTERAWSVYETVGQDNRDVRLKQEMMSWLSMHHNEEADSRCMEMYASIPPDQRTLQVHEAALSVFLRREQFILASKLHKDVLRTIDNGHRISRTLFRYAVEHQQWELAIDTEAYHHEWYTDANQAGQISIFWLHVSEMPHFRSSAVRLFNYVQLKESTHPANSRTREFCAKFIKEALSQELIRSDSESLITWERGPPRVRTKLLFRYIVDTEKDAAKFFEDILLAMLRPHSRVEHGPLHHIMSYVYFEYSKMAGVRPTKDLLFMLLERVSSYGDIAHRFPGDTISIQNVTREWHTHHSQLSKQAVKLLMSFYARHGLTEEFEQWLDYLRSVYPDYQDQKDALWGMVYLHARRADLDRAQQAFAEIRRVAAEHGDEPDLKCWNILLHAHSRADDLEGSLTNFKNLSESTKLVPDEYSFHPILAMLAKRGDVEGTEDLLKQYDQLSREKRTTALVGSLITAHVKNDDVRQAEEVMRQTIPQVRGSAVIGSLTGCFNILLTAHALRRDVDATMRTYRWMTQERINKDANTFATLIQALTQYRQMESAYKILKYVMKDHGVKPTAFHYAICMVGYVNVYQAGMALKLHAEMVRRNINPTFNTNAVYLKAKAMVESAATLSSKGHHGQPLSLGDTINELRRLTIEGDGADISSTDPNFGLGSLNLPEANPAAHFDFLIFIHGKRNCFEAVKTLHRQYMSTLEKKGVAEEAPPIRLLTSLMSAHWRAGEYTEVEQCWKLAKEQADVMGPLVPVPLFRPRPAEHELDADPHELEPTESESVDESKHAANGLGRTKSTEQAVEPRQTLPLNKPDPPLKRPAPARRHILTRALGVYLVVLERQQRIVDAITTVSQLLRQGYTLDNRTWNYFIRCLCRTRPPLALLAFTLTEQFLIPYFPGWRADSWNPPKPQTRRENLEHIQARYLRPGQLMPEYKTFVRLATALLEIRRMETVGSSGTTLKVPSHLERYIGSTRDIRSRASKTLFAVQSMPKVADDLQSTWLSGTPS